LCERRFCKRIFGAGRDSAGGALASRPTIESDVRRAGLAPETNYFCHDCNAEMLAIEVEIP